MKKALIHFVLVLIIFEFIIITPIHSTLPLIESGEKENVHENDAPITVSTNTVRVTKNVQINTDDTFLLQFKQKQASDSHIKSLSTKGEILQKKPFIPADNKDRTINIKRHPAITHDNFGNLLAGYEKIPSEICVFNPGSNYEWWGTGFPDIYYVNLTYPSLHFKGYTHDTLETYFVGTMVGPSSDNTHGGATYTHEIIGDHSSHSSYILALCPWYEYGWSNATMAENAVANYHDPNFEWAWGLNSYVMDTTFSGLDINDGMFLTFRISEEDNNNIIWPESNDETEGCLSTDCIIDSHAQWFINESYGNITYAGYAVFDPLNETTNTHVLAVCGLDWEDASVFGNYINPFFIYNLGEGHYLYSIEHPVIDADNGNIIIMAEVHNQSELNDTDIIVYQTDDGDINHLEPVAMISAEGIGVQYPEISHVQGDVFLAHVTIDEGLYVLVSYDGGRSWSDVYEYYIDPENPLISEYRNCDIGDKGSITVWEYNASLGDNIYWVWTYRYNTVKLIGSCSYEGGAPVSSLRSVEIINLNNSHRFTAELTDNDYELPLLHGFDIWPGAMLRVIARDDQNMIGVQDFLVTTCDQYTHVLTVNVVLDTFYRDLKHYPFYPSLVDSGATTMKQILDYCMWNNTIYSEPQSVYNEQTLYNTYSGGDWINTTELCNGLNTEINDDENGWIYGYFFAPSAHDQALDALRSAVIWLDYNISGSNQHRTVDVPKTSHPYHVPVLVPTNGAYDHWMTIKGIHTNRSMWNTSIPGDHTLLNGSVTIYGFWISDSNSGGIGENTYVTAEYFNQAYYQPLNVPGDYYNNTYVVVTDPPQNRPTQDTSNLHLTCTSPITSFTDEEKQIIDHAKRIPLFRLLTQEMYCQQAREFGDTVLQNDLAYGLLFTDAKVDSITVRGTHCVVDFKNDDSPIRFDIYLDAKTGTPEQISIS